MRTVKPDSLSELRNNFEQTVFLPDPSPEDLKDPKFEAIWQTIKIWDIAVPGAYQGRTGAMGNHVMAILRALETGIDRAIKRLK